MKKERKTAREWDEEGERMVEEGGEGERVVKRRKRAREWGEERETETG
jgi:hypothetical protein